MVDAAVVIQTDPSDGERYLVAFIVQNTTSSTSSTRIDYAIERELQESLSQSLPQFMVPSFVVAIDSIPLMSNDKTDRRTLASWTDVLQLHPGEGSTAPFPTDEWTDLQKAVVGVFQDILKHRRGHIDLQSKYVI